MLHSSSLKRGTDRWHHLWAVVKNFVHSEKTLTAPCRRPKGQRFLNTEPGARAQSYTSCSTDTLLWGASSSITVCVSMHDWRLDWDMFVAAFARRRSRFCAHLHNGSETMQPRPFSMFAFNYAVLIFALLFYQHMSATSSPFLIQDWPVGFHRHYNLALVHCILV